MQSINAHRTLLLPGWQNSDKEHWQSRWEQAFGFERVEQDDWLWPRRGDWMARLDEVILQDERPTLLVAHSLGCHLAAAWAEHSRHSARVSGALLVAPPDLTRADLPPQLHNWRGRTTAALLFPAIMAVSSNDPYCSPDAAGRIAVEWNAEFIVCGDHGHLNGEAGLGDWPVGQKLLAQLMQR